METEINLNLNQNDSNLDNNYDRCIKISNNLYYFTDKYMNILLPYFVIIFIIFSIIFIVISIIGMIILFTWMIYILINN